MDDLKNKSIKIENYEATLTSGDLINIIQHSVTRDDMESLRKEFKDDFVKLDNKIDNVRTELKSDIAKLDNKIDSHRTELKAEISEVKTELKAEILEVKIELKKDIEILRKESKQDKKDVIVNMRWGFGVMIAILCATHFIH